ncbi:MAG: hypothetical protein PHI85_10595 [Victivallaceae bacterium]|nr:hypothetical protein [Victivallaceae bacterium]MDD4818402.1 hypothetical protein [Victivallaceae bacterium]
MRFLKKIGENVVEYSGPALGAPHWYTGLGWTAYDGALPLSRLDIADGAVVELPEPPPAPVLVSKLALKRKLEELDLWAAFKTALENGGYWEDFTLANRLSTGDADFQSALTALSSLSAELDVDALLAACPWEG